MGLFSTVPGCTWLYLALPDCTRLYLALPWSAMIYLSTDCHILPLAKCFCIYRLKCSKAISGWVGWDGSNVQMFQMCLITHKLHIVEPLIYLYLIVIDTASFPNLKCSTVFILSLLKTILQSE